MPLMPCSVMVDTLGSAGIRCVPVTARLGAPGVTLMAASAPGLTVTLAEALREAERRARLKKPVEDPPEEEYREFLREHRASVIVLAGVVLISGLVGGEAYGADPPRGVLLGLLTALAYSGYLIVIRRGGREWFETAKREIGA